MNPVSAIAQAVSAMVGSITSAVSSKQQANHEEQMARYQATSFKEFYHTQTDNTTNYILAFLGLFILLMLFAIIYKKSAKS